MKVKIKYSLFDDTIAKQLKAQKITFSKLEVKTIQEHAFHAMSLNFHKLISDSQRDTIIAKIHLRLEQHLTVISGEINFKA
ncbi:hypothetical protein [Flavobacterium sp. 14A]|uniref:hypothetical protein n=1 Tax=Flavobacterium sp. 14A TaxID=2735896 RepID=UPI001570102C|nr:hypothetical protein [Flavobacterium sp. 14A]NRT11510.1 hypothetical protein [Flavobacterium sp. 14A]